MFLTASVLESCFPKFIQWLDFHAAIKSGGTQSPFLHWIYFNLQGFGSPENVNTRKDYSRLHH